jgi:hypothetical protein
LRTRIRSSDDLAVLPPQSSTQMPFRGSGTRDVQSSGTYSAPRLLDRRVASLLGMTILTIRLLYPSFRRAPPIRRDARFPHKRGGCANAIDSAEMQEPLNRREVRVPTGKDISMDCGFRKDLPILCLCELGGQSKARVEAGFARRRSETSIGRNVPKPGRKQAAPGIRRNATMKTMTCKDPGGNLQ